MTRIEKFFPDSAKTLPEMNRSLMQSISEMAQNLKIVRIERTENEDQHGWLITAEGNGDDPGY